ncbi:sigma 54-interacting transcriptional regulator [Effusibacillus lacus]|uniref:HTH-type transcriptional regulatory protein TyrR n=1 Tax=Effusibacillus lacus TaxID=1348429 RepID=A0A292YKG6_9BACL|nr:sigma 54-interacting transcriptional regulator [Effusibacillus lacus]TCS72820.1 PAS domain S-box-containing protein [Effusibacillus lacus]GAX89253.1 hypothetical protein EFBL_0871 [Effusibacillus lacus]
MEIKNLLNTDYRIVTRMEWKNTDIRKQCLEEGIVFVTDGKKRILGMMADCDQDEPIPVGEASLLAIEQDNLSWDSYSIWLVIDEIGDPLGWIGREVIYRHLYHSYKQKKNYYESILASLPFRITVFDKDCRIRYANKQELEAQGVLLDQIVDKPMKSMDKDASVDRVLTSTDTKPVVRVTEDKKGIYTLTNVLDGGVSIGAIKIYWEAAEIEKIAMNLDSYVNLVQDLKAVFDSSYDVIYVSDGQGMTLRVSSAAERLWGYKEEELVGQTVYELEKKGVFKPSITRLVLEKKEKVQAIQTTKTGRRLKVVGTPIKDEDGNIIRVINTSRDITEESRLQSELEETKQIMQGYKRELEQLKQRTLQDGQLIVKSQLMKNVIALAEKVADFDSTVLILGESGVGKEIIASHIYQNSPRKDKPFIKVNCGAIPENLLESELFGYDKGAFTGASKDGKMGLFELAHDGTLFLDEIGEIPLALQVKLLRVLQEKEFVRVGGTRSVQVNVRIIAATNRNLEEEVRKNAFREDLYYRLNVVPIRIPPLRERQEDILPLAVHFLEKCNKQFNTNKSFSRETAELLQAYKWPGNVRELQNIIERLVVTTEQKVIEVHHLPDALLQTQTVASGVSVSNIIPLQQAIELVERQLLTMAKERYNTTTKIAEVLGVNQSTISRKLNKLGLSDDLCKNA